MCYGLSRIFTKITGNKITNWSRQCIKQKICSKVNRFLWSAGATGIAPSASKFGGTDFQTRMGLERLFKRAFRRDFCFLKGFFCLLGSFYIELGKTARKDFLFVRITEQFWSMVSMRGCRYEFIRFKISLKRYFGFVDFMGPDKCEP